MSVISELIVNLGLNTQGYDAGLAGAEGKAKSAASSIGASLSSAGAKMQKTGAIMTAAVTAPIVAMGVKATEMASDLEESRSKVEVVFGEMAEDIIAFSDTAALSFGMTSQEALAAAGTYGNLFTAMGIGVGASAEMSQGLVALAADLASFNNMDPTIVLDKLRAGLTGETEPLKTLGVNLNAAMLEAKAMEMGLIGVGETLTASAKAQASYALIMEQTTTAQGDFARTSEGLANQQRILKAQFGDAAAEIGTKLLPMALELVSWLSKLLDKFTSLPDSVQNTILVFAGIAAAIGPVLVIVGTLVSSIGSIIAFCGGLSGAIATVSGFITATLIPAISAAIAAAAPIVASILPVIAIVAALAAIAYVLYLAWTENWGGIQEKTAAIWGSIKTGWQTFTAWISTSLQAFLSFISGLWDNNWLGIQDIFSNFVIYFQALFAAFRAALEGDWTAFGEHLRTAWDAVWENIKLILSNAWAAIVATAQNIVNGIKAAFEIDWGAIGRAIISGIANAISGGIQSVISAAESVAQAALNAARGFLGIHSPSQEFYNLGEMAVAGLVGALSNTASVQAATKQLADAMIGEMGSPIIGLSTTGASSNAMPDIASAAIKSGDSNLSPRTTVININNTIANDIDIKQMTNDVVRCIRQAV